MSAPEAPETLRRHGAHVQEFDRAYGSSCWSLPCEAEECAEVNASSPRSQLLLHHQLRRTRTSLRHLIRCGSLKQWEWVFSQPVGRRGFGGDLLGGLRPSIEPHATQCRRSRVWGSSWVRLTVVAESERVHDNVSWCRGTPLRGVAGTLAKVFRTCDCEAIVLGVTQTCHSHVRLVPWQPPVAAP